MDETGPSKDSTPAPKNLSEALAKFQYLVPAIPKDVEVEVKMKDNKGKYKFKYASFASIVQTIKKPMYECGLSFKFTTIGQQLVCRIRHVSEGYEDTSLDMPKMRDNMQENGSFLTYMSRYLLKLALGLDVDGDDDANIADGNEVKYINKENRNPDEYEISFGLHKGKKLKEFTVEQLHELAKFYKEAAAKQNKEVTGPAREFLDNLNDYLDYLDAVQPKG